MRHATRTKINLAASVISGSATAAFAGLNAFGVADTAGQDALWEWAIFISLTVFVVSSLWLIYKMWIRSSKALSDLDDIAARFRRARGEAERLTVASGSHPPVEAMIRSVMDGCDELAYVAEGHGLNVGAFEDLLDRSRDEWRVVPREQFKNDLDAVIEWIADRQEAIRAEVADG